MKSIFLMCCVICNDLAVNGVLCVRFVVLLCVSIIKLSVELELVVISLYGRGGSFLIH